MDMSSSTTSGTAAASAPHNHQQEAMVSSPVIKEEARSPKQAQATQQASGSGERKPRPQLAEALKCPRCNSNNTKFCYYNNYSTTQPRYFCKGCRRYWTHGGALRNVPVGGGCRKNKRAYGSISSSGTSSSSSVAYAPLSSGTNTSSSKMGINTQLMMVPNMMMPTPTTSGLFPNVLPTLMSTGGGDNFNFTMDSQHASLPFTPMSLSNQALVPVLAAGGSGTMPSFLEMLRRGLLHGSNSYDAGIAMSGSNNGMDMSFPLPAYGVMHGHGLSGSTTDDARQLVGTQQGVNTGGGFAGSAGVQEEEEEEEGDNKAMVKSSKNNNGGSLLDRYWTNNNNKKGQ